MAVDVRERDSFAPLFVSAGLQLTSKAEGSGGAIILSRDIALSTEDVFQSLTVERAESKTWSGTLTLFDRSGGLLIDALITPGTTNVLLEWNWAEHPRQFRGLPDALRFDSYRGQVIKSTPTFAREGATYTLEIGAGSTVTDAGNVADAALHRYEPRSARPKPPRSWPKGTRFSQMVRDIAEYHGWVHTVTKGETTFSTIKETFAYEGDDAMVIPRHMNYIQFISQVLIPLAHDLQGNGYVFFFDAAGRIHFHPPAYLPVAAGDARLNSPLVRSYTVFNDPYGEVIEFAPDDSTLLTTAMGGGNVIYRGVDSDGGVPVERIGRRGKGIRTYYIPNPSDSDYVGVGNKTPDEKYSADIDGGQFSPVFQAASGRHAIDIERTAIARHAKLRHMALSATLRVKGTHGVDMMDYLRVRYFDLDGRRHYLSGLWQVFGITHDVTGSSWETEFMLKRQGIPEIPGVTNQTPTQVVSNEGVDVTPADVENDAENVPVEEPNPERYVSVAEFTATG